MVLCCISLMISNTEHHFMYLLAIWENVCLDPLPIFKFESLLFYFFFSCMVWFLYIFWVVVVALSLSCVWLFCAPMDCSPPGSFVHGISRAWILDGLPFPSPWDLSDPMDWTQVPLPEPPVKPILATYPIYDLQGFFFHFIGCLFFLLMALSIS